jgi:hypothetical protein
MLGIIVPGSPRTNRCPEKPGAAQHYVVAPGLSEEIADYMGWNTFKATITPIMVGHLELGSKAAFDRIEADLAAGRAPFALMPAQWPT